MTLSSYCATDIRQVADDAIDALPAEARVELAAIWQERGASELKVAGGFSALSAQLIEHGTGDGVLKLVSRAVRDEVHHAKIAVEMAARCRSSAINNRRDVVSRPSVSSPAAQARVRRRRVV